MRFVKIKDEIIKQHFVYKSRANLKTNLTSPSFSNLFIEALYFWYPNRTNLQDGDLSQNQPVYFIFFNTALGNMVLVRHHDKQSSWRSQAQSIQYDHSNLWVVLQWNLSEKNSCYWTIPWCE